MATYIAWKDFYSVGDPALDAEHKQIIENVNELYDAVQGAHGPEVTKCVLDRMVIYVRNHFDHEEKLLKEAEFPYFEVHKALHDKMRRQTLALRENASLVTARDMLVYLKDWWLDHIQGEDKLYSAYLTPQRAQAY